MDDVHPDPFEKIDRLAQSRDARDVFVSRFPRGFEGRIPGEAEPLPQDEAARAERRVHFVARKGQAVETVGGHSNRLMARELSRVDD
jgi:hypothetical protein